MLRFYLAVMGVALAGCTVAPSGGPVPSTQPIGTGQPQVSQLPSGDFGAVVRRVEPVAENMCRQRAPQKNCDFLILLDTRKNAPSNAFQTLDKSGRPVLIVTQALVDDTQNADEIAFVLSHEAAHHIEDHLPRTQQSASGGAMVAGLIVAAYGGSPEMVQSAQEFGAMAGARVYSKNYELEADRTGTVIAKAAGFNPVRGAEFFTRISDPGDQFLGTHPPNGDRQRIVQQTAAQLD
ncbi:M48 family metallopeptidase [Qingshengfaniella alkalisoli]|uniref:M48 family metalloprotease n=1 Tax=Qingshengfaniella alkalisoli TaxID=2599296 RepID=A0A5B8IY64_9RHOB|nr:M48 family metallopeptidase [Qingshengfaniella alkalisoli]QDY69831.1 M48 family metalloprotease [Qingshengfaniella alkalisoli]